LNEAQVRSEAAPQLDCEPDLLKLESVPGAGDGVARYVVRGCGQTRTLDCVEGRSSVHCKQAGGGSGGDSEGSSGDGAAVGATAAAAGCACANLLARRHDTSSEPASTSTSPMSTTPQRSSR